MMMLFALSFPGGAEQPHPPAFALEAARFQEQPARNLRFTLKDAPAPVAFSFSSFGRQPINIIPSLRSDFNKALNGALDRRNRQVDLFLIKFDSYSSEYLEGMMSYNLPLDVQLKLLKQKLGKGK